jgi:hypothetical protein
MTGFWAAPASSAGFFESIFGPSANQAPQPAPFYPVYSPRVVRSVVGPRVDRVKRASRLRPKKTLIADKADKHSVKCCSSVQEAMTAISHDPTLRSGDIVVTERGLKVFTGAPSERHPDREFTPIVNSRAIPENLRQIVLMMNPVARQAQPQSLTIFAKRASQNHSSTKSVAFRSDGSGTDETIVDSRGRTMRFVGGYADAVGTRAQTTADNLEPQQPR